MKKRKLCLALCASLVMSGFATMGNPVDVKSVLAKTITVDPYNNSTYTHADAYDGYTIRHVIDVSYHRGTIDWDSVKADGIDYALLRMGYRGYGASGTLNVDSKFKEYIKGALDAGVKVGIYFYTEAVNTTEAKEEADFVIKTLADYKKNITLPVAWDFEPATNKGRSYKANLSKSTATNMAITFCDAIEAAGYTSMIYANKSDFTNKIDGKALAKNYKLWLANYSSSTSYDSIYDMWQYTSKATVDGISGSSNVDCSFWYVNGSSSTKPTTTPKPTATPTVKPTATPTIKPTATPTIKPTATPTVKPTATPTVKPTATPTVKPTATPTVKPTATPTVKPTATPTVKPTATPTIKPTATPEITSVGKVTSFKATGHTDSVTLSWKAGKNAQGYQLERRTTIDGSYKKIKTLSSALTTTYKDEKLTKNQEYSYRIRGYAKTSKGTIYSSYVTLSQTAMSGKKNAIMKDKAVLYKKTSTSKGSYGTIPKNGVVNFHGMTVLNNKKKYYHVSYYFKAKKYQGYIASNSKFSLYKAGTTTANLNLRKDAGTHNDSITKIPQGTAVAIISKKEYNGVVWYKVKYTYQGKNYSGYASSDYINF